MDQTIVVARGTDTEYTFSITNNGEALDLTTLSNAKIGVKENYYDTYYVLGEYEIGDAGGPEVVSPATLGQIKFTFSDTDTKNLYIKDSEEDWSGRGLLKLYFNDGSKIEGARFNLRVSNSINPD